MQIIKHDESYIVKLSDGSVWRIWPADLAISLQWLPTTEIDVVQIEDDTCSHVLVNSLDGSRQIENGAWMKYESRSVVRKST